MRLKRVISGGQTGVDRAALEAATACGIPIGGWCPEGRRAEDGTIPDRYPLTETPSREYPVRTKWNVRDSDATLIMTLGTPDGGTRLTAKAAASLGKPCLIVRADDPGARDTAVAFIDETRGTILNVAGPRESRQPGIFPRAREFLIQVFRAIEGGEPEVAAVVPRKPPGGDGAEANT